MVSPNFKKRPLGSTSVTPPLAKKRLMLSDPDQALDTLEQIPPMESTVFPELKLEVAMDSSAVPESKSAAPIPTPLEFKFEVLLPHLPDAIKPEHLADKKNLLLYTPEQIQDFINRYVNGVANSGEKLDRKDSGLPYSVNFIPDPNDPNRAIMLFHYRKLEIDDHPLFSAATIESDNPDDKLPGGVLCYGNQANVRVGQLIHLVNKQGSWCIDAKKAPEWMAIKMSKLSGEEDKSLKAECEKTQLLGDYPGQTLYYHFDPSTGKSMLLMPLFNGKDIKSHLMDLQQPPLTSLQILSIIGQIWKHLEFIFEKNWIHRDIKPENILLDLESYPVVRIVDFGTAISEAQVNTARTTGTPEFIPISILNDPSKKQNTAADIYAFGRSIFIMAGFFEDGDETITLDDGRKFPRMLLIESPPPNVDERQGALFDLGKMLMDYEANKEILNSPNGKIKLMLQVTAAINKVTEIILKPKSTPAPALCPTTLKRPAPDFSPPPKVAKVVACP